MSTTSTITLRIDYRESGLLRAIEQCVQQCPTAYGPSVFSVVVENLDIGDIVVRDATSDLLVIERKRVDDLANSIKDGRYDEQSFRLHALSLPNPRVVYLVEGNLWYRKDKATLHAALFSLNYYKGFSVMRSLSLEESAFMLCNLAAKLHREANKREPFHRTSTTTTPITTSSAVVPLPSDVVVGGGGKVGALKVEDEMKDDMEEAEEEEPEHDGKEMDVTKVEEKEYASVIKKAKKHHITEDNIGEIMLSQIPGVSATTAQVMLREHGHLAKLIEALAANPQCLDHLKVADFRGKERRISKVAVANVLRYLLRRG